MHKFSITITACFMAIAIISCTPKTTETSTTENTETPLDSTDIDMAPLVNTTGKSYDDIGIDLLKTERIGELKMGTSGTKLTELFGTPEKKSKPLVSEADAATHQTWEYKALGISVDLVGENELETNSITMSAPCTLKTSQQIGIGDTKESVLKAYSDSIDKDSGDDNTMVAGSVYGGVIFTLENNKVKSIFIGASAE